MQGHGRLPFLPILLVLISTLSATWAWPGSFHNIGGLIMGRQQSSNTDTALPTLGGTAPTTTITSAPTTTGDNTAKSTAATSGSAAATTSGPTANSSGKSGSTTKHATKTKTTSISINPVDPPGGVQLVTPAAIDGAQYYKVGDYVTFAWNYTSLSVTPTAVDVLASCATNNQIYTIALNQSITGATQAVTWDTGEYQSTATIPFVVASYTLLIYDAAQPSTAIPSAGYLGEFQDYIFGMYTGQPYVPIGEFKCSTCSGALSTHERQALGVLLLTCTITVLSFSWFAGGFGVFS